MIISFGIFQTYYVSTLNQTRSDIAWVGSIAVFLLFFMGIISGRLTDAGYLRITTISGAVLVTLGTFMTSLTDEYWQVVLSQGLCTGLGNGLLLTPMMTLITMYFRRRLPIVMGVVSCGSVTGGLIYPSMARTLLPSIGFGWTLRAMGFIQLGTFAIALNCGKPKQARRKSAPMLDWAVSRDSKFTLYLSGCFLVSLDSCSNSRLVALCRKPRLPYRRFTWEYSLPSSSSALMRENSRECLILNHSP